MTLRPKHYKRIKDVTDDLASVQTGRDIPKSPFASFSYDREIKRIHVQLVLLDLANSVGGLQFSPDLAILLGFRVLTWTQSTTRYVRRAVSEACAT